MTFSVTAANRAAFDPATKLLSLCPDPNPVSSHHADVPWYSWLLGPIATGIAELVVKLIADGLAAELNRNAGEALSVARTPPTSVRWADSSGFDVREVGIQQALYLHGTALPQPSARRLPPALLGRVTGRA